VLIVAALSGTAFATEDRNALLQIVSRCLDSTVTNYCQICRAPLEGSSCVPSPPCSRTTEVWNRTHDYVAIRDAKACGCPAEFVHGLAIPLAPLTCLDNSPGSKGIWQFAWQTALRRIDDPLDIGLIVNPPKWRSQDQLHVHILRLRSDARERLAGATTTLASLDSVWQRQPQTSQRSKPLMKTMGCSSYEAPTAATSSL